MTNILTLINNIACEAGYTVDEDKLLTSTNTTSKQLLQIANRVIAEMGEKYPWARLFKSGEITTVADQELYSLPGDFSHYHHTTFWNKTDRWRMWGPISPVEYSSYKGYNFDYSVFDRYQIRGPSQKLSIIPVPGTSGEIVRFEYAAKRYVRPRTWESNLAVNSGDYIYYDENYYTASASGTTGSTAPTHTSGSTSDGSVTWAFYDGAYEKFLADTDEPVLHERVFTQGILENFLSDKKDLESLGKFDRQMAEEFGREQPGEIIGIGGKRNKFFFGSNSKITFSSGLY